MAQRFSNKNSFLGRSYRSYGKLTISGLSLMGLAIATAVALRMVHGDFASRAPASVLTDDEGEPVFWEESIDELNRDAGSMQGASAQASVDTSQVFASIGEMKEKVSADQATRETGIKALRARRAFFVPAALYAGVRSRGRITLLNLFSDTKLRVAMNAPSAYRTNAGVYTGQVVGDPKSQVRLFVEDGHVNGFIETQSRHYRILDSLDGNAIVLEVKADRSSHF